MLEEHYHHNVTTARRCAQILQEYRLRKLTPRCPCGESEWPCNCPRIGHCVVKRDEISQHDQCGHLLNAEPVFMDDGTP